MTNDASNVLKQLNDLNEQLSGLPSGTLTFVLVLMAAYALRWWKLFPDRYVAPICTLGGTGLFCGLAPYAQEHMRIWVTKNAMIGFVISFLATVAMLKFGERLPFIGKFLKPSGNTDFMKNPNPRPATPDDGD